MTNKKVLQNYTALVKNLNYPVSTGQPVILIWIVAYDEEEANKMAETLIKDGYVGVIEGKYIWQDNRLVRVLPIDDMDFYYNLLKETIEKQ